MFIVGSEADSEATEALTKKRHAVAPEPLSPPLERELTDQGLVLT